MKEPSINGQRAVVAHHQAAEVAAPGERAFHGPSSPVTPQRPTVLRWRLATILAMRGDQLDAAPGQSLPQRVTVVAAVGDEAGWLLPGMAGPVSPPYADRRERGLREPDLRRGSRVKVVSQRKTRAVDHHHPLRPLAPLGFADASAPFFAGAKLPSRNASLQFSCWRSFNSPRNARQITSQISCSSQSRNRRQQVVGDGNSSGKSCQRAPLRSIHKMPSSTLRSSARGRPPRGRRGRWGSKGRIFSHWASVNSRPYRAIRPPPGAVRFRDPPPKEIQLLQNQLIVNGFEMGSTHWTLPPYPNSGHRCQLIAQGFDFLAHHLAVVRVHRNHTQALVVDPARTQHRAEES